ncbi:polysaccharide biosynthesis protein [Ethanoligenens harbinense YUAN-3]|uniref:Polysaccharide biosynthesis protein n=2 Tax=Ethanoligenens harbinense TaxID=253239 RepID=E6U4W6_ETHHY|nr:polysaccharide biosynthesis protein [Ethanoligenens harbinense YUAN-3]
MLKFKSWTGDTKNVAENIMASFVVKGMSLLLAFFTTPMYLRYFSNKSILGIWFTVLSVLAWILNFDFGIGNGLRNKLTEALAENNQEQIRKYISSSYIFLSGISCLLLVVMFFLSSFVDWNFVFNISTRDLSKSVLNTTLSVLLTSIILQFNLQIINSILYALQKAFVPGLLNFATNAIMLIYVIFCNEIGMKNNVVHLAIVYLFAVNAPLLITTIFVFSTKLRQSRPSIKLFEFRYAVSILKLGGAFLWLQLMALISNNTNSYLIALFVNNKAVVEYQIYYKIFALIGTVFALTTTPLWSAVTKAKVENNYTWLNRLISTMRKALLAAVGAEIFLLAFLQIIFNLWLQEQTIAVNYGIAVTFAICGALMMWGNILSALLNGLSELKLQAILLTVGAFANIPLAFLFVQLTHGYVAIMIANIISTLPYCIGLSLWLKRWQCKMSLQKGVGEN